MHANISRTIFFFTCTICQGHAKSLLFKQWGLCSVSHSVVESKLLNITNLIVQRDKKEYYCLGILDGLPVLRSLGLEGNGGLGERNKVYFHQCMKRWVRHGYGHTRQYCRRVGNTARSSSSVLSYIRRALLTTMFTRSPLLVLVIRSLVCALRRDQLPRRISSILMRC